MSDQPKDQTPKGFQSPLFAIIAEAKRVRMFGQSMVEYRKRRDEAENPHRRTDAEESLVIASNLREQSLEALLTLILGGES